MGIYKVVVRGPRGEDMEIDLCNTEEQMKSITVLQLKDKIFEKIAGNKEYMRIRLTFADKELYDDSALLSAYGVQHMSVIHMVLAVMGGGHRPGHGEMGDKGGKNRSMERLDCM